MKTLPIPSLALGVCLLALSAGVAFAANLKDLGPNTGTVFTPNGTGQTGSNVLSNCNPSPMPPPSTSFGAMMTPGSSGSAGNPAGTNGSPFNANLTVPKKYAGNPGSPTLTNGASSNAVAQYDNACAQHALH